MRIRLLFALIMAAAALPAQKIQINVGTAAPEGSPWHNILQKTREDWARISGGNIVMRIYPAACRATKSR